MKPLLHLLDGAIALAFLIMVIAGVDLRWIFGAYLVLGIGTNISKAITAFLEPINEALRRKLTA